MAKIKSDLVVALAVVLVLNAMGSDEQKICGKSDGSGKTLWTGDCAGSQTFAVKEKLLVANFEFTGSAGEDQMLNFDIGGCKFAAAFSYSTATHTAELDIDGNKNPRILPITAEITPDKVVFKREGRSNVTVSCSVNFDSVSGSSGSFKISVKYEPTKPEQLKDLKTTYEAPIFVGSEKAVASSPWLWSGIGVLIFAGVVVICVTLWCFRGKFQRSNLDPPTKIKVKSSKKLKKEKKKQDSKSPKEFSLLDISNENLKVPEKSNSKGGKEKLLTEKVEIKTAKKDAPPIGTNDVVLKTAVAAPPTGNNDVIIKTAAAAPPTGDNDVVLKTAVAAPPTGNNNVVLETAEEAAPPTGNNNVMLNTAEQPAPSVGERPDAEAERRRLQEVQREAEELRDAEEREANGLAEELRAIEDREEQERRAEDEHQANRQANRRATSLSTNTLEELENRGMTPYPRALDRRAP